MRRAKRAGLSQRIEARVCRQNSLEVSDLANRIDFVLLFALVHEVSDKEKLFSESETNGETALSGPQGTCNEAWIFRRLFP